MIYSIPSEHLRHYFWQQKLRPNNLDFFSMSTRSSHNLAATSQSAWDSHALKKQVADKSLSVIAQHYVEFALATGNQQFQQISAYLNSVKKIAS